MRVISRAASLGTSIITGVLATAAPQIVEKLAPRITVTADNPLEYAIWGIVLGSVVEGFHMKATLRRSKSDPGETWQR